MKTSYFKLLSVVVIAFIATACERMSDSKISEREIIKQVNLQCENMAQNSVYIPIQLGSFECNSEDARLLYRQLDAAGLVSYKVNRYAWWEKYMKKEKKAFTVTRRAWYYTYEDTEYRWVTAPAYDFCDHYIVDIALTEAGEKIYTQSKPEPNEEEDADLKSAVVDESLYVWNQRDLSEHWEYISNPFVEEKEKNVQTSNKTENSKTNTTPKENEETPKIVRIDSLKYEVFNKLKLNSYSGYFKAVDITAIKARNIQIVQIDGVTTAMAEVIFTTKNTTDAGRIMYGIEDGRRWSSMAVFKYYLDKGWVLDEKYFGDVNEMGE